MVKVVDGAKDKAEERIQEDRIHQWSKKREICSHGAGEKREKREKISSPRF